MPNFLPCLTKKSLLLSFLLFSLLLTGCATVKDQSPEFWDAKRLYQEGVDSLKHEDYGFAIDYFERMESRFPFEPLTQQAMLMNAFAYYKSSDPESAIASADRFIKLYPTHPEVDYAYYLRGLAHFHSRDSFMDDIFDIDAAKRDPESVQRSFNYFAELVNRFPESQYVEDAKQRMQFLRNSLARHELHVAQHYIERGAYIAAVKRCQEILERFSGTPATGDALATLIEAYLHLEHFDLAGDTMKVLQLNYPEHPAIDKLSKKLSNA